MKTVNDYLRAYWHDLAGILCSSFSDKGVHGKSEASVEDLVRFRGVCEAGCEGFPSVLIVFAMDRDEDEEDDEDEAVPKSDFSERQAKQEEMAKLRNGLGAIGLKEMACYEYPFGYAMVVQQAVARLTFNKAARQLTKLLWDLAD